MTKGAKIHRILGFMCADEKTSWYDTADIAKVLDMKVSEVNSLMREVISNGHAKESTTKDQAQKRSMGILCITATCDAYEMKHYLKDKDYYYHFYISANGRFNLLNESYSSLQVIIEAYDFGKKEFTVHGDKFTIENLQTIKIYRSHVEIEESLLRRWCKTHGAFDQSTIGNLVVNEYFKPQGLKSFPDVEEVTGSFLENREFGNKKNEVSTSHSEHLDNFIDKNRIEELRKLKPADYDLTRLLRICEELNDNFSRRNFIAISALTRTLMNHIPPIFGFKSFKEVASSYGGGNENRSLKANLQHLQNSLKHIADRNAHQAIRNKEALPSEAQINFRPDVDVLLEEVVRILKTNKGKSA